MKDLKSVLLTLVSDPSAPMKTRAAVASALGDCTFLVSQVSHIQLRSTKVDLCRSYSIKVYIRRSKFKFLITRFQKILFFIFGIFFLWIFHFDKTFIWIFAPKFEDILEYFILENIKSLNFQVKNLDFDPKSNF